MEIGPSIIHHRCTPRTAVILPHSSRPVSSPAAPAPRKVSYLSAYEQEYFIAGDFGDYVMC